MLSTSHAETAVQAHSFQLQVLFGWRRLLTVVLICSVLYYLLNLAHASHTFRLPMRIYCTGLAVLLAFGLFEQWPRRLPGWLTRWALQVSAVGITVPVSVFLFFHLGTAAGAPPFWDDPMRMNGFVQMALAGTLVAPWTALAALLRQGEAKAEKQAIEFELERTELARQALDARMRLLTAQAQPHFLFNTLANVQALVEAGSPRAPRLLQSLTDYLRAAVPRLDGSANTLGQELELVRAYLELMQMRMPDRLAFDLHIGAGVHLLRCPPMTLLTLVENAVQHGIDPSEEGGRIDVHADLIGERHCRLSVADTGVGLQASGGGLGTGLVALRERLHWAYGAGATLELSEVAPHGVHARIEFDIAPQ
ncbi:histidine kinase [Duganella fentianensis]|uniref:sensor histidine kinase n=1 Tax=Duganella fentianensis TaxID=2692177 RepID=UPI0032B283FB